LTATLDDIRGSMVTLGEIAAAGCSE